MKSILMRLGKKTFFVAVDRTNRGLFVKTNEAELWQQWDGTDQFRAMSPSSLAKQFRERIGEDARMVRCSATGWGL
jgi:hypothetical protein